jgi:hypothetical protein
MLAKAAKQDGSNLVVNFCSFFQKSGCFVAFLNFGLKELTLLNKIL